jgi:hypothetical protein
MTELILTTQMAADAAVLEDRMSRFWANVSERKRQREIRYRPAGLKGWRRVR